MQERLTAEHGTGHGVGISFAAEQAPYKNLSGRSRLALPERAQTSNELGF